MPAETSTVIVCSGEIKGRQLLSQPILLTVGWLFSLGWWARTTQVRGNPGKPDEYPVVKNMCPDAGDTDDIVDRS